jgi:ATP adenylyltransferase
MAAEFNANVWAPWRAGYLNSLTEDSAEEVCFLCEYAGCPQNDALNWVIIRREGVLALLNRYPYTGGHVLIAPFRHVGEPEQLAGEEWATLAMITRVAIRILQTALHPQGFNVGMNLGRCAGAGLPGHLHWHVVPRWNGDNNFLPVVGNARVASESLEQIAVRLRRAAIELGLP